MVQKQTHKIDQEDTSQDSLHSTNKIEVANTGLLIAPGIVLDGKYLIEAELGRGGIGVVYQARDKRVHDRLVVIKLLLAESDSNEWLIKKFRHESEALARINHPGIVKVYDRGELENTKPYFVMEFIEGQTLRKYMTPEGVDFSFAAKILGQLGDSLEASHTEGVIHRDLKPENIMLQKLSGGMEQVKLIDFGIAKVKDPTSANQTTVALTVGTALYMAPEQMETNEAIPSSDIFSLGVIAYELLTGKRPFNPIASSQFALMVQVLEMHQQRTYPKPRELRPSLPEEAEAAILKALSYNSSERYVSAKSFTDELVKALAMPPSNRPIVAQPNLEAASQTNLQPQRIPSRSPLWQIIGGIAVLAVLGLVVIMLFIQKPATNTNSQATLTPIVEPNLMPIKRTLSYWMLVKKDPKRYPDAKPFRLPGEINFDNGSQARLFLSTSETGYFYLLNESPQPVNGLPQYIMLFPKPVINEGKAELSSNQEVQIPNGENWLTFDEQEGTEKLWLIWAKQAIPELETVKRVVNPTDRGIIKDEKDVKAVQDFIVSHTIKRPQIEKDDDKKLTIIKSPEEVLVNSIKLEHH